MQDARVQLERRVATIEVGTFGLADIDLGTVAASGRLQQFSGGVATGALQFAQRIQVLPAR
jgi:hypothetical protein